MSAFSQKLNLSIPIGSTRISAAFGVGEFARGSFVCTAVTTGNINFDVSNDGTNWETLTLADTTFADITAPTANKVRALPSGLFKFRLARFHVAADQAAADAAISVSLFSG